MSLPQEFWKELPDRTDDQLFDAIAHSDDYVPEALAAVRDELRKRDLSPERPAQVEAETQPTPPPTEDSESKPSANEGDSALPESQHGKTNPGNSEPSAKRYYLIQQDNSGVKKRTGPFTYEQLDKLYCAGAIDGDSLCWPDVFFNWGYKPLRVFFPHFRSAGGENKQERTILREAANELFRSPSDQKQQKGPHDEQQKDEPETSKETATTAPLSSPAPPKGDILFYYKVKDDEKGPYTLKQLTSMWDNGQITADALHRPSDSSEWLPLLQRFSEVKPLSQPTNGSALEQKAQAPPPAAGATNASNIHAVKETETTSREKPAAIPLAEGHKEPNSKVKTGCLGCLGIVVVLIIIGAIFNSSESSKTGSPSSTTSDIDTSPVGVWIEGDTSSVYNRLTVSSSGYYRFETVDFTGDVKGGHSGTWELRGTTVHYIYDGGEITGYRSRNGLSYGATTFHRR